MGAGSGDLDSWRIFFRTVGTTVFDVINNAIIVAAEDHPLDLKLRRDQIVHLLYNHCCPYNPIKTSISLEKKRVFQTNASCKKKLDGSHYDTDGPDEQNGRIIHPEDFPSSCEKGKSNGETKISDHPHKVDGNCEEIGAAFEQDEIFGIENNVEAKATNPTELMNRKDSKTRVDRQDQIQEFMPAESIAPEHNGGPQVLDSNVVSNSKDGALQDSINQKMAISSNCINSGGSNMNKMGGLMEQQEVGYNDFDGEKDEAFEEVSRITRVLDVVSKGKDGALGETTSQTMAINGDCVDNEGSYRNEMGSLVEQQKAACNDFDVEKGEAFQEVSRIKKILDVVSKGKDGALRKSINQTTTINGDCVDNEGSYMNEMGGLVEQQERACKDFDDEKDEAFEEGSRITRVVDVVSKGKDGALRESINRTTAINGDCVDNGGSYLNKMGGLMEQQKAACKDFDGEKDEEFEEVSRMKRVIDVVSNGKDGALQVSINQTTATSSDCVDNGRSNLNEMGGPMEQQKVAYKDFDVEKDETFEEVSRIKRFLDDSNNLSDRMLVELLMKLQKMDINVEILQATMIGKAVKAIQKHSVKEIRKAAHLLIRTWRRKVDEWVQVENTVAEAHSSVLDECPLCPLNEGGPAAPSASTELLQIFQGVDQTEFFSILPHDFSGSRLFPEELSIEENNKNETTITVNPTDDAITEKMRVEDLTQKSRNSFQFLGSHETQKNTQASVHQSALDSHKGKGVNGKDLAEKQNVKQVKMEMNIFSRDRKIKEGIMKQRIPSLPKMHTVAKYNQCVGNEGTVRNPRPVMNYKVSTIKDGPVVPSWVKNTAQFEQNLQRSNTSRQPFFMRQDRIENGMLQKVEETRRKLREGYQNAEDAKKRRAIQVIDANNPCASQQHKRFRPQYVRRN